MFVPDFKYFVVYFIWEHLLLYNNKNRKIYKEDLLLMFDMGAPKMIAIVHWDRALIDTLDSTVRNLEHTTSSQIVNRTTNPNEVADFITQTNPNLVFLAENFDASKGGEGIGALAAIRERYRRIPVYMISGGRSHYEKAMELRASGYIPMATDLVTLKGEARNYSDALKGIIEATDHQS